ncbi:MAG: LPS export ABC transporter permease LptF [Rickettsiales bacterium]|nr:LPS export ABC transporter permease LptF [Rickettsiales bacterium]
MYRYNSYIARHLVHSTLLITFSLTSIIWLTQALRFIDFIVNQGVSVAIFLKLTALLVPSLLFMILPPAFFCSVLFVYHKLKGDSELVVLQGAGLSNWRLARPAIQVAMMVTILAYLIAIYLLPASYRQFKEMQYFLRNNYASIFLEEGVFSNPVDGLTVFIRERDSDNILHGILVHDSRQANASVTMMAEEGKLVETPKGPRFLLKNGNRQEMSKGKLSLLNFEHYALDISLYTKSMRERIPDPQELYIDQLFTNDPNLTESENKKRVAEGHQRLLWPAYVFCLGLIALAVVLSGQFSRRGQWQRIAFAVVCATVLLFSSVGLRGFVAIYDHAVVVAYLNLLLPMWAACWVLSDHSRVRKIKSTSGASS